MLRPSPELRELEASRGPIRPYTDPRLATNRRTFLGFFRLLQQRRMLGFSRVSKARIGTFFVWKKDHHKIRLILDAREASRLFADPPAVQLLSAEGLASFQVEGTEGTAPGLPGSLHR